MNVVQTRGQLGGPPDGAGAFVQFPGYVVALGRVAQWLQPMLPTSDVVIVSGTPNGGAAGLLDPHGTLGLQRVGFIWWLGTIGRAQAAAIWPALDWSTPPTGGSFVVVGDDCQSATPNVPWRTTWLVVATP